MNFLRFAAGAFAAVVIFIAVPSRAAEADPRVAQLVAASGQSLGVAALAPFTTMRIEATVSAIGLQGTTTQYVDLRDGRFAESTNLGPLVQLDGYDGRVELNSDGTHLVWNSGGDSDRSSEINQAYLASYSLWKPNFAGADVQWVGTKTDGGRSYDALSITPAGSKVPFALWFDGTTHLPARALFVNGFNHSMVTFSDPRRVDGLLVAYAIHTDSSDGNNADVTLTRVTFDPPGANTALARPQTRPTDFSMLGGKTMTTIPVTLAENHVYLDVMLNGKGPYHFVFDTGGANIVDPAVAKEIGAVGAGSAQGSGVGSQTEGFSFARVSNLHVGDAVLSGQLFAVAPTRLGFGVAAGHPVDGLIGWEVLARYVTTFDYANRQVTLSLPGTTQAPANGHVVPFVFYGTQPQIACTIDGIPAECTIDTGARDTISFMSPFVAAHPEIVPATTTAVGITGFGVGGPAFGKLAGFVASGSTISSSRTWLRITLQTAGAFNAPFVAANIGGNLLRRFTITFDYGNGTMTLVPNAAFSEADAFERSGLFLINRAGSIVVADARPGTPAASAGISKGDVIDSVDGKPANGTQLASIRKLFAQPAGTAVTLTVIGKDGTQRTVTLTLRDYV